MYTSETGVQVSPKQKVNHFTLTLYFNIGGITVTSYTKRHKDIRRIHVPPNSPVNSAITEPFRNKAGFGLLAVGNQKFQIVQSNESPDSKHLAQHLGSECSGGRTDWELLPANS